MGKKAILVMNMPKNCAKCEFCLEITENHHCCQRVSDDNNRCKRVDYDVEFYQYEKPKWCPLKEIPEKQITYSTDDEFQRIIKEGYNACIDEILGGSKKDE